MVFNQLLLIKFIKKKKVGGGKESNSLAITIAHLRIL